MEQLYRNTAENHLAQVKTITRLQETKAGRMAVFFDNAFDFSVDEETFVRYHLKVGQRYTQAQYEQLVNETQYMKAKEKAFTLLSYKSWTRKLLQQRLEQDFAPDCVEDVLDRMEQLGLINDADYAVRCARDLVNLKHYSLNRVRQELERRGISRNNAEDALVQFDDYDEAQAVYAILQKKYGCALREEKGRRRAFNALLRLGYAVEDIRSQTAAILRSLPQEESEPEEQEEVDPSEEIRTLLLKKYKNVLGDQKGNDRAIRGLMRKGYHYGDIRRVLEELLEE